MAKKPQMKLNDLLIAHPQHRYFKRNNDHSVWISCLAPGCTWQQEFARRMNALVRASQMRSAFLKHLRELEASTTQ